MTSNGFITDISISGRALRSPGIMRYNVAGETVSFSLPAQEAFSFASYSLGLDWSSPATIDFSAFDSIWGRSGEAGALKPVCNTKRKRVERMVAV